MVGSSQVYRLLKKKLDPLKAHNRVYFKGARREGSLLEDVFEGEALLEFENFISKIVHKEPFRRSKVVPWLCATPDFLCEGIGEDGRPN